MAGRLVLVVGPSGAGKDTLLAGARAALQADGRFVFIRRVVTRHATAALEDHESLDATAFETQKAAGAFALDWQAHGLCYGLPAGLDDAIASGSVAVANGSRRALAAAVARYPDCGVLLIDARPEVRAARLLARGRESAAEIAQRLERETQNLPDGVEILAIDNSGRLEDGISAFIAGLKSLAVE